VRVPHISDLIFGDRKEQITLSVIFDLSQRTGVTLKKDGSHCFTWKKKVMWQKKTTRKYQKTKEKKILEKNERLSSANDVVYFQFHTEQFFYN
jgi:hypothetical protein